ncbi:WD40 repeat domain-containing serine/threonine protein kinase [Nocardiopsis sp. EMB25]|uniref:WD40 repeat domain-containing serine/threonine protein kinase n=1 Tax=Nocardiopsis sp. EMB25 TaxID=2835867 RepID=UPI00228434BA|nr:WD40 repeat domain-containing serine/threonine protein kinase [Nocardiopsis sp. EMB25]MCY9784185.1 WD40 repeat domain-containing serine/threonine protein kinase [Nocardiopsis sp. EMB25]
MQRLASHDPRQVGPYRIITLLGAGGMGRVYLGLDSERTPAAVKVVRAEYAYEPDFRARFARELDLVQQVHGPHTPRVLAADPHAPTPWMATEYVLGPSLHDLVRRAGPLPERTVLLLARGIAQALERVHTAGLVHRDLKPGNVMVDAVGPQVIDFGIARALAEPSSEEKAEIIGTPGYMAPETVRGGEGGSAADVFAFGGVLVYALTGTGPFGTGHPAAIQYRITSRDPELTGVPDSLIALVSACLDKDPHGRPTAAEVLRELGSPDDPLPEAEEWLPPSAARIVDSVGDEYRAALAAFPASGTKVLARRRPMLVGGSAAALVLLVGAGTWAITGSGGGAAPHEPAGERDRCDVTRHIAPEFGEAASDRPTLPTNIHNTPMFSADGSAVAVGSNRGIVVWDWEQETEVARIDVDSDADTVRPVLSPDGCRLGFANSDGAHVYVLETGEHTIYRTGTAISAMAFSPDGETVALTETGGGTGSAMPVLDLESGEVIQTLRGAGAARNIVYSPDGEHVGALGRSGSVTVWDVRTGQEINTFYGTVGEGDSLSIPTNDGDILYLGWDEESVVHSNYLTGESGRTFDAPRRLGEFALSLRSDRLFAPHVDFSGEIVMTDEESCGLTVWEFSSGERLSTRRDEECVRLLDAHPDGEVIIALPIDNAPLWVLDTTTLRLVTGIG